MTGRGISGKINRHSVPFFRPFKPSVMQEHADCLLRLCRVCGGYMNLTRSMSPIYCCANYASDLMMVLGINTPRLIAHSFDKKKQLIAHAKRILALY